jgi:hypothetical protein
MSVDVVALFNADYRQILRTARPARASITEEAQLPEHPLENSAVINDHKIFNPVEVEIEFFLSRNELKSTYQELRQLYRSEQLVTVQTRTDSYGNMTIARMPHEETPDIYDAVMIRVTFREVQQTQAQFGPLPPSSVRRVSQSSTRDRGEQLPGDASTGTTGQASLLFELFN